MFKKKKKIVVGMSGGVDSSVSAYLLKKEGYHIEGLFMKNWEEDDTEEHCSSLVDFSDARKVCDDLKIKLHIVNFSAEFWENVFKHFLSEYKSGRTPNPDILCNKEIKFKVFLEFARKELDADYIATGHYVRCNNVNGKYKLLRGIDKKKDQSYFLYTLNDKQISKSIFPVGKLEKSTVREIAKKLNLITANKKDSTGICFIGKRKFKEFIKRFLPFNSGKIITVDGDEIGNHSGLVCYTFGQRKGIGIGGIKKGNQSPWYVVDKDIENNVLIVAQGHNHPCLMSVGLVADRIHWISYQFSKKNIIKCTVKIRYQQNDIPCVVTIVNDNCAKVYFEEPIFSVTPGQSAVFYNGEECLGGGIIKYRFPLKNFSKNKLLKY